VPGEKEAVVAEIARCLGVPMPRMSTGSTEPKAILIAANTVLGLGLDGRWAKPRMAEGICRAAGLDWDASCWSTGSTVTLIGLRRVLTAARILTGEAMSLELVNP
jgi:hypothetical protein